MYKFPPQFYTNYTLYRGKKMGKKEDFLRKIYVEKMVELKEFEGVIPKEEAKRVKLGNSLNNPDRVAAKLDKKYTYVLYGSDETKPVGRKGYFEIGELKGIDDILHQYKVRNRKKLDQIATKMFLEYLKSIDHENLDEIDYAKTRKEWLFKSGLITEGFYRLSLPFGGINKNNFDELYRYTVSEDIKAMFKKIETGIRPMSFERVLVGKFSNGERRKLTQEESSKYEEVQTLSKQRLKKNEQDRFVKNYMKVFYNFERVWYAFQICADEIEKHTVSLLESMPSYLNEFTKSDYIKFYKTYRDLRIMKQEFKIPSQQILLYDIVKNTTYTDSLIYGFQKDFEEIQENKIKARREFFLKVKEQDQRNGYESSVFETYKQYLSIETKIIGDTLDRKFGEEYNKNFDLLKISFNDFVEEKIKEQLEVLLDDF